MQSPIDTRRLDPAHLEDIDEAVRLLRGGHCVAVPTETVYGLAADASNPEAVRGIFAAKQRPTDHPLIVHLPSAAHLTRWAHDIPDVAWQLADAFWPGPLTLLLPKAAHVPAEVTGGRPSIGLRVPAHPVMLRILTLLDGGLAAPSANPYQRLSPTTVDQVLEGLGGRIAAVIDGGPCTVGLESTIVDLTGPVPRIVRAGPITRHQLEVVLGCTVEFPRQHDVAVPGNVAVHYRPGTPLHVIDTATLRMRLSTLPPGSRVALAYFSDDLPVPDVSPDTGMACVMRIPADKPGFARALYATLHALDHAHADVIWLERPPSDENWSDVHDRLSRAATS